MLLERGADINAGGGFWGTALQAAAHNGYLEIVKALLDAGAGVNIQGGYHGSALMAACLNGIEDYTDVAELLLKRGADPLVQKDGCDNVLEVAALEKHGKVVEMLVKSSFLSKKQVEQARRLIEKKIEEERDGYYHSKYERILEIIAKAPGLWRKVINIPVAFIIFSSVPQAK